MLGSTPSPELIWFGGHFEQVAILPGVAQVDWALSYGQTLFTIPGDFSGLAQLKFQAPARAQEALQLTLHWLADQLALDFTFEALLQDKRCPISRGRALFTQPGAL